MLFFFFGLIEKQLRQQLELTLLEVAGDTEVLQARAKLVADLPIEGLGKTWTD
jgi:hypothetical protein